MVAPHFPSPAELLVFIVIGLGSMLAGPIVGCAGIIVALGRNRSGKDNGGSRRARRLGAIALVLGYTMIVYVRGGYYQPTAPLYALPSVVTGLVAIALALPRIRLIHLVDLIVISAFFFGTIVALRN